MKKKNEIDINIVKALKKLPKSLRNFNGVEVCFNNIRRGETIYEHIAKKSHKLKIRDIEIIPIILLDHNCIHKDNKSKKFINYYAKRKGKNLKISIYKNCY